ncbi:NYN domain-containing protein [bacterium]|nr:NYN domain-containing protein [candidate division CSSED10-310 bacterium]
MKRCRKNDDVPANAWILVDAYNVIHADRMLKSTLDRCAEQARDALRVLCRHYTSRYLGHHVRLVFDGDSTVGPIPEISRHQRLGEREGIRDAFTVTGETADRRIVSEAAQLLASGAVRVVTRDQEVIDQCRIHAVSIIAPEHFLAACRPRGQRKPPRNANKEPGSGDSTGFGSGRPELDPRDIRAINNEMESIFIDPPDMPDPI